MPSNIYITDTDFNYVLADLNYECDSQKKQQLLNRATADFEADMAEKYYVPLTTSSGAAFAGCPQFARNKVLNAVTEKIRALIGVDKARNLVIDSTEKFINTHASEYKEHIKRLLDNKIDYGFKLLNQAEDARESVQHLGLARANNVTDENSDDDYTPT